MKKMMILRISCLAILLSLISCEKEDESIKSSVSLNVIEGESIEYVIDGQKFTVSIGEHWDDIRSKLGEPELTTTYSANYWGTNLAFNNSRYLTSGTLFPLNVTSDIYKVESASTESGISMGDDRAKVYEVYGTNFNIVAGEEERFPDFGVRFGYNDEDKVEYIWLVSKN